MCWEEHTTERCIVIVWCLGLSEGTNLVYARCFWVGKSHCIASNNPAYQCKRLLNCYYCFHLFTDWPFLHKQLFDYIKIRLVFMFMKLNYAEEMSNILIFSRLAEFSLQWSIIIFANIFDTLRAKARRNLFRFSTFNMSYDRWRSDLSAKSIHLRSIINNDHFNAIV